MIDYNWRLADMSDIDHIVDLGSRHFKNEIDTIFTYSTQAATRNVTFAIMNQIYYPGSEMITVCRAEDDNRLLAYTWAKSNDRTCWSDDAMVCIRFAHLDLTLSPRLRIRLVQEMMQHWEKFAVYAGNKVICSTTMRHEQDGFLRLHQRNGYSVRGSYAYKRLASRDSLQS